MKIVISILVILMIFLSGCVTDDIDDLTEISEINVVVNNRSFFIEGFITAAMMNGIEYNIELLITANNIADADGRFSTYEILVGETLEETLEDN